MTLSNARDFQVAEPGSDICFNEAIMVGMKERRNGQKDRGRGETKGRREKSRPAIARRAEGGTKRGKSDGLRKAAAFAIGSRRHRIARQGSLDFLREPSSGHEEREERRGGLAGERAGVPLLPGPDQLRHESAGGPSTGITVI